jgi:GT2 family glycosyltransferase
VHEHRCAEANRDLARKGCIEVELQAGTALRTRARRAGGCTLLAVARAAVVIPSWNGAHFLGYCLQSLAIQSHPARIIVVDNGSTDGSAELVRTRFPDVTVLSLSSNRGFAGAVNEGIAHALTDGVQYVALLNNDWDRDLEAPPRRPRAHRQHR